MFNVCPTKTTEFKEGDSVVLAEGTYQGTPGVFIRLRQDINWAEILERSGAMRCHPVVWLQPADPPGNTVS
jgi:transcription antitermination factor NusG